MGAKFISLGSSTNTTALGSVGVGDLESVYVSIGGTFSATGTVEISFDGGTTWEAFGSGTSATLVGPLPKCHMVRGKNSARASGTVVYKLVGNKNRGGLSLPVGQTVCGRMADITSQAANAAREVSGCGPATVWVKSADFVGTYQVEVSLDGGTTWAPAHTAVVVANGATSTAHDVPCRGTHVRVNVTAFTSGTLSARYGAHREPQV